MKTNFHLTFLFILCFTHHVQAQLQYEFEHLSTSDGLSNGRVSAMVKDHKGFMWFSTWDGLNRFDGNSFKVYKHLDKNGVATSNRITTIDEDDFGNIWGQTSDGKIFRFNTLLDKFEELPGKEFDSLQIAIKSIAFMPSGDIWLLSNTSIAFRVLTDSLDNVMTIEKYQFRNQEQSTVYLNTIKEDQYNKIWICTNSGVKLFKRFTKNKKIIPEELPAGLELLTSSCNINAFCEVQNRVYFGTDVGRIFFYDNITGESKELEINNKQAVTCFSALENGMIFIGTAGNGIFEYTPWKNGITAHFRNEKIKHIFKLYPDSKGLLWIESLTPGISMLDLQAEKITTFTQDLDVPLDIRNASQIGIIEEDDCLWFTFKGGGFGFYDYKTGSVESFFDEPGDPNRKFSNFVNSFYKDSEGVLWLSTYFKGVEKISFRKKNYTFLQPAPESQFSVSNEVRALLIDSKNRLWVATKDAEVFVMDSDFKIIRRISSLNGASIGRVYAMQEDKNGNILLGTKGNGLFVLSDFKSWSFKTSHYNASIRDSSSISNDNIYAIKQDSEGSIWIATYGGGLNLFEGGEFSQPLKNKLPQGLKIRYIEEDGSGRIWLGSTSGIYLYDKKKNIVIPPENILGNPGSRFTNLLKNDIFWIYCDDHNIIWVASLGGGLTKLDYSNKKNPDRLVRLEHISKIDGLPSDVIFSIIGDQQGNLWMATENGVANYNSLDKTFNNYAYLSKPSVFSEGSASRLGDGSIVFGANNGIYIFHPDQIDNSHENIPLVFSDFQLFGNSVLPQKDGVIEKDIDKVENIVLKHHQNAFTVKWAGLTYNRASDLKFSYKLEGYDEDWRIAQEQNTASYAKVPPGEYKLMVKMLGPGSQVPETLRSLNIRIKPSIWLSYQMIIVYFVLLVLLGVFLRRTTLTIIKLRNKIVVEKELNNMKLDFFTNISHELRTPLTLILGPAKEIKRSEPLTKKGNIYISLIEESTQRLLNLVNSLLDFRKIQSKKMDLNFSRISINSLISETCRSFEELAKEKNIAFEVNLSKQNCDLEIDKEKIRTVLINLLSNALKFTPRDGLVRVDSYIISDQGVYVFRVLDNGPGITIENSEKIFQPFVSFSDCGKNQPKGTGIGLALSKELIEMHHGDIICDTTQSSGAAFIVRLPFSREFQVSLASDKSYKPLESAPFQDIPVDVKTSSEKESLLIVDDNEELRRFLVLNLSGRYDFFEAKDGKEGIKLARKYNPDIILSDIMMPVMDGIAMLDILKNDPDTSHIPIVLLSAKASVESKIEGLKYGADAYLTKPFNSEQLQAQLQNLIKQRSQLRNAYLSITDKKEISDIQITSADDSFLQTIKETIENNLTKTTFRVDDLYVATNMGRSKFSYKLKGLTGLSPIDFIKEFRLTKAMQLLKTGEYNVSEVSYLAGYTDAGYFSKSFKERFGKNPSDLLRK